ncbi:MAG: hypothetical protein POH28_16370 [Acidocella sp.]|nr:hypothetical protein [Acidocella sp.]
MAEEDPNWKIWMVAAQAGDARAYAHLLAAILPWLRRRARSRWPQSSTADIVKSFGRLLAYESPRGRNLRSTGNAMGIYTFWRNRWRLNSPRWWYRGAGFARLFGFRSA